MKLYTLDGKYIKETQELPDGFTGCAHYGDLSSPDKSWFIDGAYARADGGPNCVYNDGEQRWYEGRAGHPPIKLHRIGGPAQIIPTQVNNEFYWIDGKPVTKESHDFLVNILRLKNVLP